MTDEERESMEAEEIYLRVLIRHNKDIIHDANNQIRQSKKGIERIKRLLKC